MKFHTWDEHQHGGRLICVNVWRQLQTENCEEFILETGMKCSCGKIFQPAYRDLGFSDRDLGKPGHPLVWTHRKFFKGFKGKARSRKPGQHGQPGSYEEALRLWMKFYFIHCNRRLLQCLRTGKETVSFRIARGDVWLRRASYYNDERSGYSKCWDSVTAAKCCKYTSHLRKVIPTVVQREGKVSGFFLNEQTAPLGATNITSLGLPCWLT